MGEQNPDNPINQFIRLVGKILKIEIDSAAGRINLLGMLVAGFLVLATAAKGVLEVVLEFVLALSGRALPESGMNLGQIVIAFLIYSALCVAMLNVIEYLKDRS